MKSNILLPAARPRSGVTLSEVLISVALLGMGVLGLAALFPLSVLKSIQATQLTNSTNLRFNAEASIEVIGSSLFSQGPAPANTSDPAVFFVIDPVGWYKMNSVNPPNPPDPADNTNFSNWLGNDGTDAVQTIRRVPGVMPEPAGGDADPTTFSEAYISSVATLADSWVNFAEGIPVSYDPATDLLTFDSNKMDLSDLNLSNPAAPARVVVFHQNGRTSTTKTITAKTNNTVTLAGDLPGGMTVGNMLRARIEQFDPRYTWLMTVRKKKTANAIPDDPATVGIDESQPEAFINAIDVAVFFNRRYQPEDEQIFQAPTSVGRTAFRMFNNTVYLDYAGQKPPFIKKGGFILDAQNGHWYRILQYVDDTSKSQLTITLDRPAEGGSNRAVLMRGVVEVYPIDSQPS